MNQNFQHLSLCLLGFLFCILQFDFAVAQEIDQNKTAKSLWTRQAGDDWPTFLGVGGESKSNETGILKDWSDGKLKLLWETKTGEGYGMGSVAKGRFYHFGKIDGKATLLCLNAETGERLWKFDYDSDYRDLYGYDSGPRASPVIDDGRVYIYGVEGHLYCLDAVTGQEIWNLRLNAKFGVIQNFFGVASTPVVFEDLLLVMVGGSPDESKKVVRGRLDLVKSNGTGLIAIEKKTGEIRYKSVDDLASYCSLKLARINGQPLVLAWMRDALFGVKPGTGEVTFELPWRSAKLESVNAAMPVVSNDLVLISECYELGSVFMEINDLKAETIWSDQGKRDVAMKAHWNTPVLSDNLLFGCSGRHTGSADLRCIDWKTGKRHWVKEGLTRTSVTLIDGHLIVLGEDGNLFLIKASKEKFEMVTRYEARDDKVGVKFKYPCWAAPIVSHGLLYVRGKETLACFELIPESKK